MRVYFLHLKAHIGLAGSCTSDKMEIYCASQSGKPSTEQATMFMHPTFLVIKQSLVAESRASGRRGRSMLVVLSVERYTGGCMKSSAFPRSEINCFLGRVWCIFGESLNEVV